jgi:hypothetical protein
VDLQDRWRNINRNPFLGPRSFPTLFSSVGVIRAQAFGTDKVVDCRDDAEPDFEAQVLERLFRMGCMAANIACDPLSEFAFEESLDNTLVAELCPFLRDVHFIEDGYEELMRVLLGVNTVEPSDD